MTYIEYDILRRHFKPILEYLNSLDCKLLNGDTGEKPNRNMNYTQINELLLCKALLNNQYDILQNYASEKYRGGVD